MRQVAKLLRVKKFTERLKIAISFGNIFIINAFKHEFFHVVRAGSNLRENRQIQVLGVCKRKQQAIDYIFCLAITMDQVSIGKQKIAFTYRVVEVVHLC